MIVIWAYVVLALLCTFGVLHPRPRTVLFVGFAPVVLVVGVGMVSLSIQDNDGGSIGAGFYVVFALAAVVWSSLTLLVAALTSVRERREPARSE